MALVMNCVEEMIGTLLPLKSGLLIFFTKQSLIGRSPRKAMFIGGRLPIARDKKPLPVGHYEALHAAAVFKLADFAGFYAAADIWMDGAVLYQVHGTKNLCLWEPSISPHPF